jgi:hypothetical protein
MLAAPNGVVSCVYFLLFIQLVIGPPLIGSLELWLIAEVA